MPECPVIRRETCPLCSSRRLSAGHAPHVGLPYPLLCVTVDQPLAEDLFAPFTICTCEDCGLITLLDFVDPAYLYTVFHSDSVGRVWEGCYSTFAGLIAKHYTLGAAGRIVEVGAGQGKLVKLLKPVCGGVLEVIDPQYEGEMEGVTVHPVLLTEASVAPLAGQFDALVSSHTLEHFPEFIEYFNAARVALKPGGLLFTSVPNQEFGFPKAHAGMLCFEHPSACTNLHWMSLFARGGFGIIEVKLYLGHSIMFVAKKLEECTSFCLDARALSTSLLDDYSRAVVQRLDAIREEIRRDDTKENWLFGAHVNAQVSAPPMHVPFALCRFAALSRVHFFFFFTHNNVHLRRSFSCTVWRKASLPDSLTTPR
jgi:SAM-dependent methyltransferase